MKKPSFTHRSLIGALLVTAAVLGSSLTASTPASAHDPEVVVNYDGPAAETYEEDCPTTETYRVELGDYLWELRHDSYLTEEQAWELTELLDRAVFTQAQWAISQLAENVESVDLPELHKQYVLEYVEALDTLIPCIPIEGPVYVVNPGNPVIVVSIPKISVSLGR